MACALALAIAASMLAPGAPAASSAVVVTMDVSSATQLDASGCSTGTPGVTSFGIVQPGTTFVAGDCALQFGSTNDTAKLLLSQGDVAGSAMWTPGTGTMDVAFGGGGTGFRSFEPGGADYPNAVARQSTGKLVTAGYSQPGATRLSTVIRFTAAGIEDTTFGPSGTAMYTADLSPSSTDDFSDLVVLPDDRILVVGTADNGGATNEDVVIVRLTANGLIDPSFASGGTIETSLSAGNDLGTSVLTMPDGRFLVAGTSSSDIFVQRYSADGVLDTTFGTSGTLLVNPGTSDGVGSMAWAPNGDLLLGGWAGGAPNRFAHYRIGPTGAVLSSSFATSFGTGNAYGYGGVTAAPDGSSYIAGTAATAAGSGDFAIAKYTAAGALDTTWGTNGLVTVSIAPGTGTDQSLAPPIVLPDGRIVLTGFSNNGSNRWSAVRLKSDGTVDTTFGTNGVVMVVTHAGSSPDSLLGPDGKVIMTGSGNSGTTLGQFDSLSVADYVNAGGGGDTDWSGGANTFGACLLSLTGANLLNDWGMTGACAASDTSPWNAVAQNTGASGAQVAHTTSAMAVGTARLRFGVRTATAQRPGSYMAPIDVTVLAPG
ncbi:MAG: hypothetical protein JWM98_1104 [Thermoleophilia bacterium]|nr:hypothetical protein [Thermoleophilia bacterium]